MNASVIFDGGDLFTKGECFRKLRSPFRFASVEMTKKNFIDILKIISNFASLNVLL